MHAAREPARRFAALLEQVLGVALGSRRSLLGQPPRALGVELGVARRDDQVGVLEAADLLHFLGGEGSLGRAAAPEDVDLLDRALRQRLERVRRDVGRRQPLRRASPARA